MDGQFVHPAEHKILNKIYHTNKKKKTGRFGIPRPEDDSSGISYDYLKLGGNLSSNAKLLHSHFLCTQWHRDPFSSLNNDLKYLYRANREQDESMMAHLPSTPLKQARKTAPNDIENKIDIY